MSPQCHHNPWHPEPIADGVGGRVGEERKLAGLTQQLATRANVSTSLVRAVEQGRLPASPAFVSAVSRALEVRVTDLLDQPYPRESSADHRLHATVPGIRRELVSYALPPDESVRPRPLPELATAVAEASRLRHQVSLDRLGVELPGLLEELRAAAHVYQGADRERVFGLLAEAFAAAGQVIYKLGYSDLSSLATDRVEWAAAQSGDELAVAAGALYRAGELIMAANWTGAQRFLDGARHDFEDLLRTGDEAAGAAPTPCRASPPGAASPDRTLGIFGRARRRSRAADGSGVHPTAITDVGRGASRHCARVRRRPGGPCLLRPAAARPRGRAGARGDQPRQIATEGFGHVVLSTPPVSSSSRGVAVTRTVHSRVPSPTSGRAGSTAEGLPTSRCWCCRSR